MIGIWVWFDGFDDFEDFDSLEIRILLIDSLENFSTAFKIEDISSSFRDFFDLFTLGL